MADGRRLLFDPTNAIRLHVDSENEKSAINRRKAGSIVVYSGHFAIDMYVQHIISCIRGIFIHYLAHTYSTGWVMVICCHKWVMTAPQL